jgi:signal transduction histidine kinase
MTLAAPSSAAWLGTSGEMPRILVVDDEQQMCDVCARTLCPSGYEVVTTSDPNVAVRLLREGPRFDLLLTDIKMPPMSGLDLAHIARECDPAIAIIIMTGFASVEHLYQSVQRGVAEFLSKPFELDQLRLAVDQALHTRSILQDNLRLRALERLLADSEALNTTLGLHELANILLRVTLQQSGCHAGFVLLSEGETTPQIIASMPEEGELLSAGLLLSRRAFEQRQNVTGADDAFCCVANKEFTFASGTVLRAQGDINGLLLLCDDQPTMLRPGMQGEIALIANYAGAALRNAYLYNQLGDAYQRLQELDRLKSEFIAIASHELRTPLSIVLGYTMMLCDQTVGEQREYLQRVMENAQRIKHIVDDMVSLRHLETGEAALALESCVLSELIAQAVERLRLVAEARRHTLQVALPTGEVVFQSSREKLLLILGHLIANALQFTSDEGRITISAALQSGDGLAEGMSRRAVTIISPAGIWAQWVVVEVEDTGIGVPEREQARIFERFYQVADSLTRDQGGTGLGLAIVRELIHALGGALWLTSRVNVGSTFIFALPHRE